MAENEIVGIEFIGDSASAVAAAEETSAATAQVGTAAKTAAAESSAAAAKQAAAWSAAGKRMQTVGRSMTRYLSVPAAAIGAASVKMALDFNSQMEMLHTQAGASQREVTKLHDAVLNLASSGAVEQGPQALATALFHIESQAFRGADALNVLKVSAEGAAVGGADVEDTAKALGATLNGLRLKASDASGVMSQLNAIVGHGDMRMQELAGALSTGILPAARNFGLSLQDVGAALDVMTQKGVPAQDAATRLRMTFSLLGAPTATAATALEQIGINADDLAKAMRTGGITDAVGLLADHLDNISKTQAAAVLSQAFGGGRTSGAIMTLVQNVDTLRKTYRGAKPDVDRFNEAVGKQGATEAAKLQKAWASMQASMVKLGEELAPTIVKIANSLADVAKAFAAMPSFARDILIGAVVLGPMLRSLGLLVSLYGKIRTAAAGAAAAEEAAAAAGGAAGAEGAAGAAAGGLGLAGGAAVAGIGVGLYGAVTSKGGLIDTLKGQATDAEGIQADMFNQLLANAHGSTRELAKTFAGFSDDARAAFMGMAKNAKEQGDITSGQLDQLRHSVQMQTHPFAALRHEYGNVTTASTAMSRAQQKAYVDAAREALKNGDITRNQLDHLIDSFNKTGANFKDTDVTMKEAWKEIADATGRTVKQVKAQTGSMATQWIRDLKNARDTNAQTLADIAGETNSLLRSFGVAEVQWHTASTHGGTTPTSHAQQTGGVVVPGSGSGDSVNVHARVEPGEVLGVLNRNAAQAWMKWNDAFPRFQGGGFTGMQPGIVNLVQNVISRFGGAMSSGYRPGDDGFHGQGLAADWVGGDWTGASRYINSIGPSLLEGIHQAPPGVQVSWDSGHQVPPSFWGGATWAAHVSHIHMAISGAVKGLVDQIKRHIISGPAGPYRDLLQASADKTRNAANRYIAAHMPSVGVETGSGGLSVPQLEALWTGAHGPGGIAELMAHIALAESGGVPTASNPSGAKGLWQILGALVPGNLFDPHINALNAVAKWRTQGLSAWDASRGSWGGWASAHGFQHGGLIDPTLHSIHHQHRMSHRVAEHLRHLEHEMLGFRHPHRHEHFVDLLHHVRRRQRHLAGRTEQLQAFLAAAREARGVRTTGRSLEAAIGPALAGFLPPFGGAFGGGGVVSGPPGAPRTVIAHGGERIGSPVTVILKGDIAPVIRAELSGGKGARIMDRWQGRESRTLTVAPGG